MSNLERYKSVFASIFNVEETELDEAFGYGLIKSWDSITHLSLMTAIEDEFNIMFDSADILDFLSFEKGKQIMTKYDVVL